MDFRILLTPTFSSHFLQKKIWTVKWTLFFLLSTSSPPPLPALSDVLCITGNCKWKDKCVRCWVAGCSVCRRKTRQSGFLNWMDFDFLTFVVQKTYFQTEKYVSWYFDKLWSSHFFISETIEVTHIHKKCDLFLDYVVTFISKCSPNFSLDTRHRIESTRATNWSWSLFLCRILHHAIIISL